MTQSDGKKSVHNLTGSDEEIGCLARGDCLSRRSKKCMQRAFYKLGFFWANHPFLAICTGLLITVVLGSGFPKVKVVGDTDGSIFNPHTTRGWRERGEYIDLFGAGKSQDLWGTVMLVKMNPGFETQAMNYNVLAPLLEIHLSILNFTTSNGKNWYDVCARPLPTLPCSDTTIFSIGGVDTLAKLNKTDMGAAWASYPFLDAFTGGIVKNTNKTRVISAKGFYFGYSNDDKLSISPEAQVWMEESVDFLRGIMEGSRIPNNPFEIIVFNRAILNEDTKQLVSAQYPYLFGAVILILFYLAAVLGRSPFGKRSRMMLSLTSIVTVVFSLIIAFGTSYYIGNGITALTPLVGFILLGVGVDDMIVMVESVDAVSAKKTVSIPEQIAEGVSMSGHAITITSVTTFTAFMFGALLDWPITRWFSIAGAIGVLAVYVLQLTMFIGFMTLDQRRLDSHRYDVFCCFKYAQEPKVVFEDEDDDKPLGLAGPVMSEAKLSVAHTEDRQGIISSLLTNGLAPVMSKRGFQMAIVVLFILMAGAAGYGTSTLGSDFDTLSSYNPGSATFRFGATSRDLFTGLVREAFVVTGHFDFRVAANRQAMMDQFNALDANPNVVGPYRFWLLDFNRYVADNNLVVTENNFYSNLDSFLTNTTFRTLEGYAPAIFNETLNRKPNGELVATEWRCFLLYTFQSSEAIAMTASVRAIADSFADRIPLSFIWAREMMSTDRDNEIPNLLLESLLTSVAGVCAAMILFLSLPMILFLAFGIILIELDAFGTLALWGQPIDVSVYLTASMSIGLSIDYMVHIAHYYAAHFNQISVADNLVHTYRHMGAPVFNGGLSTFLGVCLLGFTDTPAFQSFFRVIWGIVLFGILHGILFGPAFLSLFATNPDTPEARAKHLDSIDLVPSSSHPDDMDDV